MVFAPRFEVVEGASEDGCLPRGLRPVAIEDSATQRQDPYLDTFRCSASITFPPVNVHGLSGVVRDASGLGLGSIVECPPHFAGSMFCRLSLPPERERNPRPRT